MLQQKIFLSSVCGICMGLCLFSTYPGMAKTFSMADFEISQGDGDPNEEIPSDLLTDEKEDTSDDAVATITAEGDFLLPTYLLPVEGENAADSNTSSMMTVTSSPATTTTKTTVTKTTTTSVKEVPAIAALEETTSDETNLQDINIDIDVAALNKTPAPTPRVLGNGHAVKSTRTAQRTVSQKPILIPLTPIKEAAAPEPQAPQRTRRVIPSEYADKMVTAFQENEPTGFIMPQEIKVSFYKNATEFSGQTLKWIKAFTLNALNDPRLVVQVRLSTQDPNVQKKRLIVIKNALLGNGLSPHQIQIVYSNRPADSLILRTVKKPENAEIIIRKSGTGKKVEKRTTKW